MRAGTAKRGIMKSNMEYGNNRLNNNTHLQRDRCRLRSHDRTVT